MEPNNKEHNHATVNGGDQHDGSAASKKNLFGRRGSFVDAVKLVVRRKKNKITPNGRGRKRSNKNRRKSSRQQAVEGMLNNMAARSRIDDMALQRQDSKTFRQKIWITFEDSDSSRFAYWLSVYINLLIIYATISFCVETIPSQTDREIWRISEIFVVVNFCLEYLLRLGSTPNYVAFFKSWFNWIDLFAVLPFFVELALESAGTDTSIGGLAVVRVVRLARIFRLFKLGKHSEQFHLVVQAAKNSKDGIMLLFFMLTLAVIFFSAAMYYAELSGCYQDESSGIWYYKGGTATTDNETPFQSIVHTFWWALVTLVTVGYGDDVPITTPGRIVAALTMVTGILVLAFPITLLGTSFGEVYAETKEQKIRRKIQIIHKVAAKVLAKSKRMSVAQLCRLYREISRDVNEAIGETRDSYAKIVRALEYYQMATLEMQQIVQAIVVAYELQFQAHINPTIETNLDDDDNDDTFSSSSSDHVDPRPAFRHDSLRSSHQGSIRSSQLGDNEDEVESQSSEGSDKQRTKSQLDSFVSNILQRKSSFSNRGSKGSQLRPSGPEVETVVLHHPLGIVQATSDTHGDDGDPLEQRSTQL